MQYTKIFAIHKNSTQLFVLGACYSLCNKAICFPLEQKSKKTAFVAATHAFLKKRVPRLCLFHIKLEEGEKRTRFHGIS